MSIQIADRYNTGIITVYKTDDLADQSVILTHDEQRELLEALAKAHGFTLVDREERKELQSLVKEVDEDENDYGLAVRAWTAWQDRAEALAAAVNQLFDVREQAPIPDIPVTQSRIIPREA